MTIFHLTDHPYIKLCDLLKLKGWCSSGAMAKNAIAGGEVRIDGRVETRKRCKVIAGQTVSYHHDTVQIQP